MSPFRTRMMFLVGLCCCLPLSASATNNPSQPRVVKEVKHDVSPPLRQMARPIPLATRIVERAEHPAPRRPFRVSPGPDPVLQYDGDIRNFISATQLFNFDGVNGQQAGGVIPPDTNGSVGASQFVLITNFAYEVFDKTTGSVVLGPTLINSIWKGFGGQCEQDNGGDPVVLWDKLANRWLVQQLEYFTSYQMCIAVSTSADATGSYNRYAYTFDGLTDYPKFGVWPDAYYISFNFFGSGFAEPCAVDRTAMLAGKTANMICFGSNSPNFGLLPSDFDGVNVPPSGSTNHYVELGSSDTTLSEFEFHVDFANPNKSTFTGPKTVKVPKYVQLCGGGGGACIPQPGSGSLLDAIGNETMFRNAYRNFGDHESLVFSHSVAAGSNSSAVSAERWYELRSTPPGGKFKLYQAGTLRHKTNNFWMGSIGMDKMGNIALGFSADNKTNLPPSIKYTGRVPTDPLGKMEKTKTAIKGAQVQTGSNRWGDYSSMSIDPGDDCTFWYVQEYGKNGARNWQSHVVAFKFDSCN